MRLRGIKAVNMCYIVSEVPKDFKEIIKIYLGLCASMKLNLATAKKTL